MELQNFLIMWGDIAIIYKLAVGLSKDEIAAFQEAALKRDIRIE